MKSSYKLFAASFALVALTGCATDLIDESKEDSRKTQEFINETRNNVSDIHNPAVVVEDSLFIGSNYNKIRPKVDLPKVMHQKIALGQGQKMSLSEIAEGISLSTGVKVHFTSDAVETLGDTSSGSDGGQSGAFDAAGAGGGGSSGSEGSQLDKYRIRMFHEGSVKSLLDTVTSRANLFWKWDGDQVVVLRQENKSYTIKAFAGTSTINASVQGGTPGENDLQNLQSAGLDATDINVWDGIKENLETMLSSDGRLSATDGTGVISVADTPLVHRKIENYIDDINDMLSKQIRIKVEIFEVAAIDNDVNGVDWSAAFDNGREAFTFTTDNISGNLTENISFGIVDPASDWQGSEAFVQSLRTRNTVSHVTSEDIVTLNGQPAPVRVQVEQGYLKSSQTTVTAETTTTTLEPGTVTSGVNMMLLPKVLNHREIMVQFALDISNLENLAEFSSGDSTIQLPTRSVKNFMQRVKMGAGDTLVLAGYERTQSKDEYQGVLGQSMSVLGSSVEGGKQKTSTLILMTPYILDV